MADPKLSTPLVEHDCQEWAPPDVLRELPVSQAGDGRHKCVRCAYAAGYRAGQVAQCKVGFVPEQLHALIEFLQQQENSTAADQLLLLWLEAHV